MTFEEAKKILEKEGFYVEKATRPCAISESFMEYEDPSICKAMQFVSSAGYFVCMEMSCFDERKARLKKEHEKHANAPVSGKEKAKKGNPALEEAASQFNDALLDDQAKKIKRLGKEIARLNKVIHKKNEDLRLSTIREKNLAELGLKYVGETEKLKKKLADKIVVKIDAQALKSAESDLAYKENVIAEKDEVIADLGKELAATKKEINDIASGKENEKLSLFRDDSVGAVTNQKDCSPVKDTHPTEDKPEEVELNEILECVRKALEEGHTVFIDYDKAEEGGDQSATIVQCDNGIILSKEEAEIIERCTKNGTELHYSEKDGLTYTNVFGEEMPIRCLRGMFHVFTDEEIENMKK